MRIVGVRGDLATIGVVGDVTVRGGVVYLS